MTTQEFSDQLAGLNEKTKNLLKKRGELIKKIIQDGGNTKEVSDILYKNGVIMHRVTISGRRVIVLPECKKEINELLNKMETVPVSV